MPDTLTERQAAIVRLIADGYTRWRIADILDLGETTVRDTIRQLCARYECRMDMLPATIPERLWLHDPAERV